MSRIELGISDLELRIPAPEIPSEIVLANRGAADSELRAHLERSLKYTGQQSIRFNEPWQDAASLAADAVRGCALRLSPGQLQGVRYLLSGTETTVDQSKPIAAYVQGMLERSGVELPRNIFTFQTQHACAGGMAAVMAAAGMLSQRPDGEQALVCCSDVARYQAATTAEVTQGAGAVAMTVSRDPALLSLDFNTAGYDSRDVDDFFRPNGSHIARVKGRYSIRCYREALEYALLDHAANLGVSAETLLRETDLFAFHVPYYSLPFEALRGVVKKYLASSRDEAENFLAERGFQESIAPAAVVGNLYSGSLFMALGFLLQQQYRKHGSAVAGKRILLGSYGSGNTMTVMSGRVAAQAPSVLERMDWSPLLQAGRQAGWPEYEFWMQGPVDGDWAREQLPQRCSAVAPGEFFLASIREDGYREYSYRE